MRILVLACLLAAGIAHAEEAAEGGRTGPGKAVLEASHERGLKLSEKALRRLGVRTETLTGRAPFRLPTSALVLSREETGVYRLRDGWYKHVDVTVEAKDRKRVTLRSEELKPGDQVVTAAAPLLLAAEMDVLGEEEVGHDH